ncbi:PH domain-containing protein [Nocardioides limicola]|uniref:PH domain-containing protein n=1 Tax=Nocardioides limicola TaxID=2803368 RepID=UPI00193B46D1|nr:PH domain-containing protein [Nocardioides sp. DJM-14]
MGESQWTQVYRSSFARVVGAAVTVLGAGGAVAMAYDGQPRLSAGLLAVAATAWLAFWRPHLVLDERGVLLRNVFRSVHLPWSCVLEAHSRYGLRVETRYGDFNAWAVPAPMGRARAAAEETEAAVMVRQRLERVRAHTDLTRTESNDADRPVVQWDQLAVVTAGVVVVAMLGLLALG